MKKSKKQEIKGAVFDADGTLFDSMELWEHAGEEYLKSIGIAPRADLYEKLETMTMEESAAYFCREYGVGRSKEEIIQEINQMILTAYRESVLTKPGVKEVLCDLKAQHIPMYVATSTDRPLIEAALKRNGIMEYFQGIITCTEAGASKREPGIYHMARERLGTEAAGTFVFEDAYFAAETASKAGYPIVVIRDESSSRDQEKLKSLADIYLESWKDWRNVK